MTATSLNNSLVEEEACRLLFEKNCFGLAGGKDAAGLSVWNDCSVFL